MKAGGASRRGIFGAAASALLVFATAGELTGAEFLRGDSNNDGRVSIADVLYQELLHCP